jgi:Cupin superfamily protein
MQEESNGVKLQERVSAVVTDVPPEQQIRMLDHKSFSFRHSLGNYPGLSIPSIQKLTRQLLEEKRFDQVYCRALGSGKKDDTISADEVLATLQSFDTAGAWLRLTRVDEINEELREICETFYADLSRLLNQDIKSQVMKTFVTLFISSPGALTPYHIDHTWNFLLQIGGRKTVHVYDENDPRVLRQQDKEANYFKRFSIKQNDEVPGIAYELSPGDGVHHPVNAPHWVQNGPDISVSLSFGLCLHASNDDAKVHQVNFLLRKLGLNPVPPRQSRWRDSVKVGVINLISDRNPKNFEEVVFSGQRRLERVLKAVRIVR